jgi:large subunit ribosomal protein L25
MSERIELKAAPRQLTGRSGVNKLRAAGKLPAVLYGATDPQPLELSTVDFIEALQSAESENVLVNLSIEGEGKQAKAHLALIQEIQHHPIQDTVLHIDFHEVRQDQKIQANVPIHEIGTATGVKDQGGILDHLIRDLHVECLPNDLPSHIDVDISGLKMEESITVGDIQLPDGVVALVDAEQPVFMVHPPRVKEEEEAPAAEDAEPEVIGEKEDDESASAEDSGDGGEEKD